MDLPPPLDIIHQPTRLKIMGLLWRRRDVGFAAARDALRLTDGNLASHATRLEAAGLIVSRQTFNKDGIQQRYRITKAGRQAFRDYLATLQAFLDAS